MGRANEPLNGIAILKRPSELLDQAYQRRVGDKRAGPQPLMQFVLVYDARRFGDEQREQIERFRPEMDLDAVLEQLSSLLIKLEAVELHAHRRSPDFPLNLSL